MNQKLKPLPLRPRRLKNPQLKLSPRLLQRNHLRLKLSPKPRKLKMSQKQNFQNRIPGPEEEDLLNQQ